jgi:integrase
MSAERSARRRQVVERNIYKRTNAAGREVFEGGYRDSTGKQRWQAVDGGIMAARAVRDDVLGRKARHKRVQPNPQLRFGEAADHWLAGPVATLRPATQAIYRNAVDTHLRPRWGTRRLDAISGDDVARLVRDLRDARRAEWTIAGIIGAARQVFRYAQQRLSWAGSSPTNLLGAGERPQTSATSRRRIYRGQELPQTLASAREPWRTLFAVAAVTGARLSELLGLTWDDLYLEDLDLAEIRFEVQADRKGLLQPLKTEQSRRTVEIPPQLAAILVRHKLASDARPYGPVFATRSGRPLGQRNVLRALRQAQKGATDDDGRPTFPQLHVVDEQGREVKPPRGSAPRSTASGTPSRARRSLPATRRRRSRGSSGISRPS